MSQNNITDYFVSAVVVAAGKSTRMKMNINKQFIELEGIPVLARTIQALEDIGIVNEIIVVVNSDDIYFCSHNIISRFDFKKVKDIVPGGSQRQNSVYNGLINTSASSDIVLIHDGARPFVNPQIVTNTVANAATFSSAVCAVRVKDTIKKSDPNLFISQTIDRESLWAIQTPQAFKRDIIISAHEKATQDNFLGTDDAVLVERLGIPTRIVEGSYYNIKITTPEDLVFAKAILQTLTISSS